MPSPSRQGPFKTWPKAEKQKHMAAVKRSQKKRREFVNELKNKPCMDCGERYPPYVMDFDHARGKKQHEIWEMVDNNFSRKRILKEVKKCDVTCSNCHRIRTHARSLHG